jgi:hypothetical protein
MTAPSPFPSALSVGDRVTVWREQTRMYLAGGVVGLLFVVVALIFGWYFPNHNNKDGLTALVTGVMTPLVGLAGTVLGFYFGSVGTGSGGTPSGGSSGGSGSPTGT